MNHAPAVRRARLQWSWWGRLASLASLLCVALASVPAQGQEAGGGRVEQPAHYLASLSVGAPLRLSRNLDFNQDAVAPVFTDAFVGHALAADIRLRHGFGVGASMNLSDEGGFTEPVRGGEQLVLMPAYLLFYDISPDWIGLAHVGVPFNVSGGFTVGAEAAGGLAYRLRAGFAIFAELGLDAFAGAENTLHGSVSAELGVLLDYEVLP